MSEPKYKVGDWVEIGDFSGCGISIERIEEINDDGTYITNLSADVPAYIIEHAVKIIPITDKPYCKDCKNFAKYDDEANKRCNRTDIAYWSEYECPVFKWALDALSSRGSGLNKSQTQLGNDNYDIETLQPPCNCCFVPKESK